MPEGTHVAPKGGVRIAATADLHFGKTSAGTLQPMLSQIATVADALIIAGDLTDYGHPEEARALVKDLTATARIPIVAVLGNHDFESGAARDLSIPRRRAARGAARPLRRHSRSARARAQRIARRSHLDEYPRLQRGPAVDAPHFP